MNSMFGWEIVDDFSASSECAFCRIAEKALAARESVSKYVPESALRVK